jgi:TM2 domain-containing membrane protein YozV
MQGVPIQPPIFFKNPTVATLLSFFITGLGQLYNGQILKGILFFVSVVISCFLMSPFTLFIGVFLAPIVWIWGMVDANSSAKRINQRLAAGASPVEA